MQLSFICLTYYQMEKTKQITENMILRMNKEAKLLATMEDDEWVVSNQRTSFPKGLDAVISTLWEDKVVWHQVHLQKTIVWKRKAQTVFDV